MRRVATGGPDFRIRLDQKLIYHILFFWIFALICWKTPQIRAIDLRVNDLVISAETQPAIAPILVGEIDAETVAMAGGTPLARTFYARLIEHAARAGVERLWLNSSLASPTTPDADARLADAMGAFGPDRIGIPALNPSSVSEGRGPVALFEPYATPLGTEFYPDADGWHRSVDVAQLPEPPYGNPARWLAGRAGNARVAIDQRIDPTRFERVSVARIMDGSYTALSGKTLILGFSPRIAGTTLNLPSAGRVDHMTMMALGAETLLNGREPRTLPNAAVIASIALIGIAALLVVSIARTRLQSAVFYLAGAYLIIACGVVLLNQFYFLSKTILFLSIWSGALLVFTAYRYQIIDVIREVSAGDLSADEAWAWRTMANHKDPVALVSPTGLKRINAAAVATGLFAKDEPSATANVHQLLSALRTDEPRRLLRLGEKAIPFNLRRPFTGLPIIHLEDVSDIEAERARLERAVHTDPMTGQLNRAGFEAAAASLQAPFGVILMDMNGFKAVNDTHGHQAGDELLRYAANRFASVLREGDCLARLGGDEFAVLLPGQGDRWRVEKVAFALERTLDGPIELSSATVRAGVAAGVAVHTATGSFAASLDAADRAMYKRKHDLKSDSRRSETRAETLRAAS